MFFVFVGSSLGHRHWGMAEPGCVHALADYAIADQHKVELHLRKGKNSHGIEMNKANFGMHLVEHTHHNEIPPHTY